MTAENKIRLLAVVGATASGKTSLAVRLAQAFGGVVVSCDSMQVYRRMDIGTAKPTEEEKCGIAHHMIDIAEAREPFSVAQYVEIAQKVIRDIAQRGKLPIVCGGTGLYLDALLRGGFEETHSDPALRESLFTYAELHGAHALHQRLQAVDPESAEAIHENNVKRVVRALEIYESTGVTKSESDRRSMQLVSPYDATVLGLWYGDRSLLYDRIDRRVEEMIANGLAEETLALEQDGVFAANGTAAQAIGYKELLGFLHGEESLDEAKERLKQATRRYAKRQLTWFRAKDYVQWIDMEQNGSLRSFDEITNEAVERFKH
ncbi:MAG: tRNA (adenosine(37)-N6)-dimethylallyltransferase MiaA [Clostridia bacterium]|nr:tRNA (adenosine(37)-N6)-dimethylallyltransferase MiaA [Clostridia bacterium]